MVFTELLIWFPCEKNEKNCKYNSLFNSISYSTIILTLFKGSEKLFNEKRKKTNNFLYYSLLSCKIWLWIILNMPFVISCKYFFFNLLLSSTLTTGMRICWLYLLQGGKTPHQKHGCLASNGEDQVVKPWGVWSTSSLPLFSGPPRPREVVPVRIPSMNQINLC